MKQHLKAFVVIVIMAVLSLWLYQAFVLPRFSEGPTTNYSDLEKMEKDGIPNIKAKDIQGNIFELKQFQGKIVILNFWASWCSPCVEEVPSLIKLIKEFKGNVQLIAISGDSNIEDIQVFLKSFPELKNENIKIVWDQDRSLMKQFGISRLPESLVINKQQKLAKKLVGSIDWFTKDSLDYINSIIH
ncbi:MAG: TlpA family protein disulfide reductase [Bdellovibrio sp.]